MASRIRSGRPECWLIALGAIAAATPISAQTGTSHDGDLPGWLWRWSVLAPRGDLPRRLPAIGGPSPMLMLPAPATGLFWTAGNPAGLTNDVEQSHTDFSFSRTATTGAFRRPLDPEGTSMTRATATSWRRIDQRLTMLGRVILDRERLDPGSQADEAEPYPTSPFVTTDTSTSPTRRLRARLEGVAGWSLGSWSLGLDLGYDAGDNETIEAGLVRRTRQAMPGMAVGVAAGAGPVRLGLVGRWRRRAETILLTERASEGQVWQLEGYRDAPPINVSQSYYRRIVEDVPSISVGAAGAALRGRWAMFVERAELRERRTRQQQNDPAEDVWETATWSAGATYQRQLGRWLISADAALTTLTGDGDLALDSAGTVFTARERVGHVRLEARRLGAGPWRLVASALLERRHRTATDLVANIGSDIRSTVPTIALELDRAVHQRIRVGLTVGMLRASPSAAIPYPTVRGPLYRRLIGPEIDAEARTKNALAGGLVASARAGADLVLWGALRVERLSASNPSNPTWGPAGNRRTTSFLFGIQMR